MGVEVEPEEAGRVEAAEAAEECGVRGVPEPALGDGGGADEAGGEVEAEEDLTEEVVVAEHHGDLGRGCRLQRQLGRLRGLPHRIHCHRDVALATRGRRAHIWADSGGSSTSQA